MPSFDIVVNVNLQEVDNAINQAQKEVSQRYDFKGSKSKIDWDAKKKEITLLADDDYKLKALTDIVQSKLIKRGISIKNMTFGSTEAAIEGTIRQKVTLQQGIPSEKAKKINQLIKDAKLKVQSQIQDEQVRVTGKKRDDLQEAIGMIRNTDLGMDFEFTNFRD
ncbi:YajQ family cyclic di-GMP-binding protein [bacterium]|nr:YajQ family cyclic di-GMP-binding protein [bacterium]